MWSDSACDPYTGTDDAVVANNGTTAQDGRIGIDHDAVFNGWVAFRTPDQLTIGISCETEST